MIFKALIFDFDGVITDTEPVHMEAWLSALEPLGLNFDEAEYRAHYLGLNDRDFLDALCRIHRRHLDGAERERLIEGKSADCLRLLDASIPLIPGVAGFIESAKGRFLMAICSGAQRAEIEFILRRLKWSGLFDPIIASDAVKRGKPDPEGYIRAMEGIERRAEGAILAEEILAIEDSPKGIAAAKAAGIRCLAIQGAFPPRDLAASDWVASSLSDVDLDRLQ